MGPSSTIPAFGKPLALSAALMLGLFLLAYAFPATFWGIDFHAFLPIPFAVVAMTVAFATAFTAGRLTAKANLPNLPTAIGVAILMGLLFYAFPIRTDYYGDTHSILEALGPQGVARQEHPFLGAFSPNIFTSKNGEQFTYSLVTGLVDGLGLELRQAFRLLSSGFGAIFVGVWMWFVLVHVRGNAQRWTAAALGLTAGATQVFYGHVEVYAAPMAFFTAYLLALAHYLRTRIDRRAWLLPLLWLLAVRSHSAGWALAPTLAYALLAYVHADTWLRWRRAGAAILGATLALGVLGYLLVFRAGNDAYGADGKSGNMFLTPLGDATPDNGYFIFSGWHLWDMGQAILLCGAMAVAVLLAATFAPGRAQRWGQPAVVGVALAASVLVALYLAVDPLLTLPRDWDLFALMAPPLLVLALLHLAQDEPLQVSWWQNGLFLAIGALQLGFVGVNASSRNVHERQFTVATHVFRSGEVGGSFALVRAIESLDARLHVRLERLSSALAAISPYQNAQNASDFSFLYQIGGNMAFELGDYALTHHYLSAQHALEPGIVSTLEDLAVTEHYLGQPAQALAHARAAMAGGSTDSQIWVLGFVSATALQDPATALRIGEDYIAKFGDPHGIGPQIEALRATVGGQ